MNMVRSGNQQPILEASTASFEKNTETAPATHFPTKQTCSDELAGISLGFSRGGQRRGDVTRRFIQYCCVFLQIQHEVTVPAQCAYVYWGSVCPKHNTVL
jgi:hypothetical protein